MIYRTRQSLPDDEYLYLLGIAASVFASNNGFVIENIIHTDAKKDWHYLIDNPSGVVKNELINVIRDGHQDIVELFSEIVDMRNRIFHGFRITSSDNEQILATKDPKTQEQFYISKDYLNNFIEKNERLSDLLYKYRAEVLSTSNGHSR